MGLSEKTRAESATGDVSRETVTEVSRETSVATAPPRTALGTHRECDALGVGSGARVESRGRLRDQSPGRAGPVPGASFAEIPQGQIRPNPVQPRAEFDEVALAELVASIKEVGRQLSEPEDEHRYELIMGERRWRASQEAGLSAIPAIIRDNRMLLDAAYDQLLRVAAGVITAGHAHALLGLKSVTLG